MRRLIKKTNNYVLVLSILILVGLVALIVLIKKHKGQQTVTSSYTPQKTLSYKDALQNADIKEVNHFIELPKDKQVRVSKINKVETLRKINPLFNRAYDGDLLIMYKNQTIIFDPTTKTVRDISSETLLDKNNNIKL